MPLQGRVRLVDERKRVCGIIHRKGRKGSEMRGGYYEQEGKDRLDFV